MGKIPYDKIRLKVADIDSIVAAFKQNFHTDDHLWIFGSRVDLAALGGDIDLYIETNEIDTALITQRRVKFIHAVINSLGEQKIDVVIKLNHDPLVLPIYTVAQQDGVQLA